MPDHFSHQAARVADRICGMISPSIDQKKAERRSVIAKGALSLKPD
jgi:hypothetical protein|tara:strand:- start:4206 stop:4343 length:138 start_codon:yes stop_codon:yes gene_type:complete